VKRWPNVTFAELRCIVWLVDQLSRPAKVMPPIVPGR
jgi:hypothetical protein